MKKFFKPFEAVTLSNVTLFNIIWGVALLGLWILSSFSDVHLFPSIGQVFTGFVDLWNEGIVVHIASSISLCFQAVFYSLIISLLLSYSTTIPIIKPIGQFISKLRYLPLTGIAFYIAIFIHNAREIQVWVLVVFMTTYLTTSLIQMISDIPEEEISHARTLGCNRWEILWEVVIKGRFDYVFEMLRQSMSITLMMLVTVEGILAAAGGIGYLIKNNDKVGDFGKVIALQIVIILLGVLIDVTTTKVRKLIYRYSNF